MNDHALWSDLLSRLTGIGRPDHLADWLGRVPLLEGVLRRHRHHLARLLHKRSYDPGEPVFRQGDIGSGMYFVYSGRVRIVSEDNKRGEIQLAMIGPGECFGELSLLDHAPRSASAVAFEKTVLYGLFEGDLDQIERTRPQVATRLLRNIGLSTALRLRQTNERLRELEENPRLPL
ncbi:MAG: cyclic nucleotide-binding domain-containing protein [Fibrobacteria bacterium]|nr:cyclic nucleotide-binding domain-containing protein [Fibrobacteria bacterium]